ncbi:hypothetical protein [Hephaestia mangrovi]|uniref:hypothetical protein n=1 Tax=Hephaestia mangrovi TaxID=2873268 RepID=UPI001CA70DD4|nr:hypothetical protein [Hephaestia mangrovi]MBY8829401.1 hypothetical protein [Hephaestia mangrovi]
MVQLFPDFVYFARRAEQEAVLAIAAPNPTASAAHEVMRDQYCRAFLHYGIACPDRRFSE